MVKAQRNGAQVVTGEVRLSYAQNLWTPQASDNNGPAKYSAMLMIPKGDTATYEALVAARDAAIEQAKSKGKKIPAKVAWSVHDGDDETTPKGEAMPEERHGHWYVSVSSKNKPGIVGRDRMPVLDPSEVYSGCYARAQIGAFYYEVSGNKGIGFGLNHIQKLRDGDPLGGLTRAEDAFDDLDEDDDDEGLI